MPKINYRHEKRQKDIQKKKKHDEKLQRRQTKKELPAENKNPVQGNEETSAPASGSDRPE